LKRLFLTYLLIGLSGLLPTGCGSQKKSSEDFPDGIVLLCASCQHGFTIDIGEMGKWQDEHPGEKYPCKSCRKNTTDRAHRCSNADCRQFFLKYIDINGKLGCPVCKKPVKA
jgi:hypothetical protein